MKAVDCLTGIVLENGWKILGPLKKPEGSTGGNFSCGYFVERDGVQGFLKALDFSAAFEPGIDTSEALQRLTSAFNHERDILKHCKERRLSHVTLAIEHGYLQVPSLPQMEGRVLYLIFEKAECDARRQLDLRNQRDFVWAAQVAKDVCLGLWQVHREMIAHQDTKPSNVLIYSGGKSKIADFGRASSKAKPAAHDDYCVPGDKTYSSPELLYGFIDQDFNVRRFGCDLYMLGNFICFLFSGANLTALMFQFLPEELHSDNWSGTYSEVLPYIEKAYRQAIEQVSSDIDIAVRSDVVSLVKELTNPNLSKRGSSKVIGTSDQYSLERFVTRLELLVKQAQIRARTVRMAS